jgi:acetoin utilization deacetylase AcuC-like enzyme
LTLPVVHHPGYTASGVAEDHRFPMRKFARLAELLVEDGLVAQGRFHIPQPATRAVLSAVHDPAYVDAVLGGTLDPTAARRIGFEMTSAIAERACLAVGGTLLAADLALRHGIACNSAGGSHHADAAGARGSACSTMWPSPHARCWTPGKPGGS